MPSAWLTNYLASLESPGGMTRQPTTQEIAADIIRKSNKYHYNTRETGGGLGSASLLSASKKTGQKGPSTVQRIFDVLSRPLYGIANANEDIQLKANKNNPSHPELGLLDAITTGARGFWRGIEGKEKTTVADIYKASGRSDNKGFGAGLRNFVLDAAVDPLNLVPVNAFYKGVKGGKALVEGVEAAQKTGTATERVERALNTPSEILGRSSSKRTIPGGPRQLEPARVSNLRRTTESMELVDPVAARVRSTGNLPRTIPTAATRSIRLFDEVPPPKAVTPTKAKQVLKDVVPETAPKTKAAAAVTLPAAAAAAKSVPFKLDVNKIATIEIARATGQRGKTVDDFLKGKSVLESGGTVPLQTVSGRHIGDFDAQKIHEYLRTGKIDAPKSTAIPDYATATPEEIAQYESHLFSEKDAVNNYYVKSTDADGQEYLISLAEVRKRIVATKKAKKLKDTIPDEVAATAPEEFPPVESFEIADAVDIVDAAGEGSQTATRAMEEAVQAQAPRTRQIIDEAGGRAVATVADRYSKLVEAATFKNSNFNPAKQANAFRDLEKELVNEGLLSGFTKVPKERIITASTGKIAATRRSLAMKHLEALEDAMAAAGHPPMTFGSQAYPLRMSDLINASGGIQAVLAEKGAHLTGLFGTAAKLESFLLAHPEARQLAAKSEAAHAAYTADLIDKGKSAALSAGHKAEIDPTRTATELAAARESLPQVAKDVVEAEADLPNPVAGQMAASNVREILKNAQPPIHRVTKAYAKSFDRTVLTGKIGKETVAGSVAKERAALGVAGVPIHGIKSEVSLAADSIQTQGLAASLLSKFKPDFRQEDLRSIYVEGRSLFQTQTSRWVHALNETWKKYPKPVRAEAFKALQAGKPVGDDITAAAAREMQDTMESMFGASGLKAAVETDVIREAITLEDMNRALRMTSAKFQFGSTVKDELGNELKVPWMDSWKYHDLKGQEPLEFIKQMRTAVDKALLEKSMFDQLALWGKAGKTSVAHPRLEGIEFDPDMKNQVRQFISVLEEAARPNSKLGLQYDSAMRIWKSGVTIYSPSHHIRNMVGDITLAWLAGVNNPRVYSKAMSVLKSNRGLYNDLSTVDKLIGVGTETKSLARQAKVPIVRAAGKQLDAEQIHTIMYKRGLLPHSKTVEDIPSGVQELKIPQPLGGRGRKVARGVSEAREHFVRTAHFIDALGKSKAKTVEGAIEEATQITRKWHPDGLDLTEFEHRYVRRVFPFYSWTRKAIPLIVEGAVRRPAKIIMPNKALYNLQISMGLDPESLSEPFPVDKEFPDWIRDMAYGPSLGAGSYIVGSNLNPVTSVTEQLGNDPRRGLAGMLTPAVRVPGELISQNDWQTGQPMNTMDKTEYIDKQIPLVSIANRLTGGNLGAGSVEALATGNKSAMLNHKVSEQTVGSTAGRDAFLNYLLAAGIINTQTPANLKSAQFDRRDRLARGR